MEHTHFFVWPDKALYIGIGQDSTFHQHHAIQLGIGLDAPLHIRASPEAAFVTNNILLALPNMPHQILSTTSTALFLWLEWDHPYAEQLMQAHASLADRVGFLLPELRERARHTTTCAEGTALIARLLTALVPCTAITAERDDRLLAARLALKQRMVSQQSASLDDIARTVFLSTSRLRHVFKDQIGLSLQRYLLWQRLLVAIHLSAQGTSLTQAAHAADFADAAHFTRVFRMTFGIRPSDVFKDSHHVQAMFCADGYTDESQAP